MTSSKAIQQVRDLHKNVDGQCAHCTRGRVYPVVWPCETILATTASRSAGPPSRYRTPAEAIAGRTVRDGDCLRWTGYIRPDGYVQIKTGAGSTKYAHRLVYELTHGPIPNGLQIDHLCRVRDCVNPDHLEAVTQQENLARKPARARDGKPRRASATHCRKGHEMTPENTYWWRDQRRCRTCMREAKRRQWRPDNERS